MDVQVVSIVSALALVMPAALAQDVKKPGTANDAGDGFVAMSSRTLIGEKKTEWIESMRIKLPIANREVGPFGMSQDPNTEVAKPKKEKIKKGAFLNAIAAIKVNTVMPSENKFTIGSREFNKGDRFPIIRNQRQFNIKIISVNTDNILFENVDTGEHVKRNLHTLPKGMKRNASLIALKGIFPANKKNEMPLNLDDESLPVSD